MLKILDLSAGKRGIWFNKNHPAVVYVDHRAAVHPAICCDTRCLPLAVGTGYSLVVFDPPHVNVGANSNLSRDYGHSTTKQIQDLVLLTAIEAHRVTVPDALMAFKWNDHDQRLTKIMDLVRYWWEPLFGHMVSERSMRASRTYWVMLRRR